MALISAHQRIYAQTLWFAHPADGRKKFFESELPDDMKAVISKWERYVIKLDPDEETEWKKARIRAFIIFSSMC